MLVDAEERQYGIVVLPQGDEVGGHQRQGHFLRNVIRSSTIAIEA